MTVYFPLIEKVEIVRAEDSDVPRVWYQLTGAETAKLRAGEWVMLVARVHSVRSWGDYETGATPPGGDKKPPVEKNHVSPGLSFRLEQNEIYYFPGLEGRRKETP